MQAVEHHASELCRQAEDAIQGDDLGRARALLDAALELDERYFPALLIRSRLELIEENFADALDDADEAHLAAIDYRDDDVLISRVHASRGHALLHLGRFHEAAMVLREAQLLVERAKADNATTRWGVALGPLCTPDLALSEIVTHLADAFAFTGRTREALDLLNSSVLFAAGPESYARLARLHERRGDFHTAAEHWRAAGPDYAPLADARVRASLVGSDLAEAYALREQDLDGANFDPSINTGHKRVIDICLLCIPVHNITCVR